VATTAGSPGIDQAVAAAFLAACPDAFIGVDTDFNVILWNPAAEHLLGWRADQVLGAPPPHLDPAQDAAIRDTLWEPDAEVFPELEYRTHADGHVVPVVVLSETALRDAAGEIVGWGRFLRGVEGGELRLSLRNDLSVRFVEAVRVDEVRAALAFALEQLLGIRRAAVLRPVDGVLCGHLGLGMPLEDAESAVVDDPGLVRRVTQDRIASSATVDGRPALLIPMGPRADGAALVLLDVTTDVGGDAIHLVTALAGEAWAALRRVELVGELEAKVEILQATAAVAASAGLDLDEVLDVVCRHAARALSCGRAAIYLGQGQEVALAHLHGAHRAVTGDGMATAAHLLAADGTEVLGDVRHDPAAGPWHADTGAVTVLGAPLAISDRTLGVLLVAHTDASPRGFTSRCRMVASALAQQAALAIENAQLYAKERTAVRSLEDAHQRKADYVDGICHDLRSPLTSLLGFIRTLRRLDEDATAADRREYLAIMERQAVRLRGMIEDMLVGARLEAGRLEPDERAEIDLAELVADVLSVLPPDRRRRVTVAGRDGVRVRGDRRQLERVVQNLVDNALNHTPPTTTVEVTHSIDDRAAVLRVRDHGAGIPEAVQATLFTRYARGGPPATGSTGLGLYIVRGIVAAHGGTVTATSTPGDGACLEVRLPPG
jgi:PAS domain S-box-containing protein